METTTNKLKTPLTWLEVRLTCKRQENRLELVIIFTNTSPIDQAFTFSNQTRKAELLGLQITTSIGQRVLPTHNLLIKPTESITSKSVLAAGNFFTYILDGIFTENGLEFPGAKFELRKGENYQLQFKYAGQLSNVASFVF
jgi:hypothetical protein